MLLNCTETYSYMTLCVGSQQPCVAQLNSFSFPMNLLFALQRYMCFIQPVSRPFSAEAKYIFFSFFLHNNYSTQVCIGKEKLEIRDFIPHCSFYLLLASKIKHDKDRSDEKNTFFSDLPQRIATTFQKILIFRQLSVCYLQLILGFNVQHIITYCYLHSAHQDLRKCWTWTFQPQHAPSK